MARRILTMTRVHAHRITHLVHVLPLNRINPLFNPFIHFLLQISKSANRWVQSVRRPSNLVTIWHQATGVSSTTSLCTILVTTNSERCGGPFRFLSLRQLFRLLTPAILNLYSFLPQLILSISNKMTINFLTNEISTLCTVSFPSSLFSICLFFYFFYKNRINPI